MSDGAGFDYAGRQIPIEPGDTLLSSLVRAGVHPRGGGPLCFGGDCPSCLATVDGVSYVRTCQVGAGEGMRVEPHPAEGQPPLSFAAPDHGEVRARHLHTTTVVIGGGESGRAAADGAAGEVLVFDAGRGEEVVGVYPGPLVVVRTPEGMLQVTCDEVVVATGAAEIQPVVPGSGLAGIVTPLAAERLTAAGVDLGRTVSVGDLSGAVAGVLVRFEGTGAVEAVVTRTDEGERRHPCDTAIVALGRYPRDGLARMAGSVPVTVVGSAALAPTLPPCPPEGVVCPCEDVTVGQLEDVWRRGFTEMELVKRATLAGTGTCQGGVCTPYLRSFLLDRGKELQPAFTSRPVTRQPTMGEIAAYSHLAVFPRTALDQVHRDLGAEMDRIGGWWRPWTYGDTDAEYWAVRRAVSVGDVSTLGKMRMTGPDAEAALQRLYPTDVRTIKPGRSRYVLMLNERGYVFDDGLVCREHDGTFTLTFTSGGASMAEMWIRDWTASWDYDLRILNQTFALGAINVTGPRAKELLAAAGLTDVPSYMGHADVVVAGVPCKLFRLSFTGELSFELHHAADRSVELWTALMDLGRPFGIVPHGLEALTRLRLEKGHILVGQDTDYDSTPRRIQHEWAVNLRKGDFIGRHALIRTDRIPLDRKLVGFEFQDDAPLEGAVVLHEGAYAGYVTSATWSPVLEKGIAMGWLLSFDGDFPNVVVSEGLEGIVTAPHFYDPGGVRPRA